MSDLKKLADIPSGWGLMHSKTAVLHWFQSDNHPSIPLAQSICGRHKSNDRLYRDVIFVGSRTKAKRCGDCVRLREIATLAEAIPVLELEAGPSVSLPLDPNKDPNCLCHCPSCRRDDHEACENKFHAYVYAQRHRAAEELEALQGHLPLTKAWDTDEQGRTLNGPFVCGTCDGGGCGDCVG